MISNDQQTIALWPIPKIESARPGPFVTMIPYHLGEWEIEVFYRADSKT